MTLREYLINELTDESLDEERARDIVDLLESDNFFKQVWTRRLDTDVFFFDYGSFLRSASNYVKDLARNKVD